MEDKKIAPAALEQLQEHKPNGFSTIGIVPEKRYTVKMNLDATAHSCKPIGPEIAMIRKRLGRRSSLKDLNIADLPGHIANGASFTPGALTGTTARSWVSQQLFCVDIDNVGRDGKPLSDPLTVSGCLDIMKQNKVEPLFVYHTFSNTPELPKFRVCVLSDEAITDRDEAAQIQKGLTNLFPGSDGKTVDLARIFFGSTPDSICVPFTGKTTGKAALLELPSERPEEQPDPVTTTAPAAPSRLTGWQLAEEYERFDLAEYIERTEGIRGHRSGNRVLFHDCPICGHHDDFDVTGPKWICRSSSNTTGITGGNIIDYLEAKHGFTIQQARDYFKSEILGVDLEQDRKDWQQSKRRPRPSGDSERPAEAAEVPPFISIQYNKRTGEVMKETVSAPLLAEHIRKHEHYIFERNGAMGNVNRFWYSHGFYRMVADDEIRGIIKGYIERYDLNLVKMSTVDEVFRQLTTDRVFHDQSEVNGDENIINFRNGVLHLDTLELHPHDPKYLCTRQIPVNWRDCSQVKTPVFDQFMQFFTTGSTTGEIDRSGGVYRLLLEFLGAAVSNVKGYRFKQALFMYGPGNSGKSQLKALAEYLVGAENCSSCDLKALEARFGTSAAYGKRLIGSSDMPYATVAELNTFKQLTGGDQLFTEFKGKPAFYYVFDGFAWFCMNRLPKFGGDNGQWVYDRVIPVEAPFTVPEDQRDPQILDKMKAEAEAIVWKAVHHLKDAIGRDYRFAIPESSLQLRAAYKQENNTFDAWFADCCIDLTQPADEVDQSTAEQWRANIRNAPSVRNIYHVYSGWCKDYENGFKLKYSDFKREIEDKFGRDCFKKQASGVVCTAFCLNGSADKEWGVFYG